jgi:prevent-host-death family protein
MLPTSRTVGAAEFKATCLRLIDEMASDGQPVTITKRGKAVAVLTPAPDLAKPKSLFGAMAGTVLRYDDPFGPATDISDWDAMK